jgi:hypothetical protein
VDGARLCACVSVYVWAGKGGYKQMHAATTDHSRYPRPPAAAKAGISAPTADTNYLAPAVASPPKLPSSPPPINWLYSCLPNPHVAHATARLSLFPPHFVIINYSVYVNEL